MNIVICGAGHVGQHASQVLVGAGHRVTVIDTDGRTPGAVVALLLAELGER